MIGVKVILTIFLASLLVMGLAQSPIIAAKKVTSSGGSVTDPLTQTHTWAFLTTLSTGITSNTSINNKESITYEFTINLNSLNDQCWMEAGGRGLGIWVGIQDSEVRVGVGNSPPTGIKGAMVTDAVGNWITVNTDHTIVVSISYDQGPVKLYVDNVLVGQASPADDLNFEGDGMISANLGGYFNNNSNRLEDWASVNLTYLNQASDCKVFANQVVP